MHRIVGPWSLSLILCLPAAAQPQGAVLTFQEALDRARESSPAVVAARMSVEEARARVIGAALPFTSNPTFGLDAGRRSGATNSADYALEVSQEFEPRQRRRARIDAARASVAQEEQRAREAEREAMREVATAFLRALESRERAALAADARGLAVEALQIAERRYAAGDVAQLDVNLARTVVVRLDAEAGRANASFTASLTTLQILLGMPGPVSVSGSLREAAPFATGDLVARAADRADVRRLEAEIAEVEAGSRFAATLRRPDIGVRASWAKEEGDRIVATGVGISLPLFDRGQEAAAVASARLARLRAEREALTRTVEAEIRGAAATYEALRAATAEYERSVLPLIQENETLALESYDVGQIGLADLLLVRREALDARRAYVDQLIETRLAEVELRNRSGVWK